MSARRKHATSGRWGSKGETANVVIVGDEDDQSAIQQ